MNLIFGEINVSFLQAVGLSDRLQISLSDVVLSVCAALLLGLGQGGQQHGEAPAAAWHVAA